MSAIGVRADKAGFWSAMVCQLLTQLRHPAHRRLNRPVLHGRRVKSALRKDREKFTLSAIKKRGLKRNAWAFPGKEFNGRATRLANSRAPHDRKSVVAIAAFGRH